jgi:signal transduction histidine kinase
VRARSSAPESTARPFDAPWFLRSRTRLFATVLLVVGLPFAAFSVDVALNARRVLESQAAEQNTAAARLGAQAVDALFEGLVRYVESYTRRPELASALQADDEDGVRSHLRDLVQGNSHLDRAFITDPGGVEKYDWPADPSVIGKSFAFRDWYHGVTREGRAYVSEVYLRAAAPRRDVVAIAVPVRGSGGRTMGYLVAQYTIAALTQRLAAIRPVEGGMLTLIDQHAHLVVDRADPQRDPDDLGGRPLVRRMLASGEVTTVDEGLRGGGSSLTSSVRAAGGWVVVSQEPVAAVYAPAKALQRSILMLALVWMAGIVGLGFVWLNVVRRHHVALVELQRQKDSLTGMIVHDLRNPLAATLGSLDLVRGQSERLDAGLREDVERATHSARRVRDLLDTLLDVMRMEEGALDLHVTRQDLAGLVHAKVDECLPLAQAASLALVESLPDGPLEANLDAGLTGRMLENLLMNAIHHTPPGGRVEVRLERSPDGRRVHLSVSDTGEGIPREALPFLFKKFFRVEGQEMGRPHDVGLGLVFCKRTVEMHRGTIEVESEAGRGTIFKVVLPTG